MNSFVRLQCPNAPRSPVISYALVTAYANLNSSPNPLFFFSHSLYHDDLLFFLPHTPS